ncbi:MAG: cyclic peptide export ABC transporter [Pyrinomonadaceae bacterium]|nr:cyclic peptide export ABC transporter [Pyrinomonadaceae bacterium]
MQLLKFLVRQSKVMVITAIVVGILNGAASTGLLSLISYSLNVNGIERNALLGYFILLCVASAVFRIISEIIFIKLGQESVLKLRIRLSRQILALPLAKIEELGAARLTVALTEDIFAITNAATLIPVMFINFSLVIGSMIYLIWLSPTVFLMVFGFIIFGIISYQIPVFLASKQFAAARETEDHMFDHFRSLIEGIKELKMQKSKSEYFMDRMLVKTAEDFSNMNIKGMSIFTFASSFGQLLVFIVIGFILFFIPNFSSSFTNLILISYTLVILYIMTPLQIILNTIPNLSRAGISVKKLESIGLTMAQFVESPEELSANKKLLTKGNEGFTNLSLVNVKYNYRNETNQEEFQLGPLNLSFKKGELIFLTGGNGSGKTTLAKLLSGLYLPDEGNLTMNDVVIDRSNIEDYRQNFSTVFSDYHLFDRILDENEKTVDQRSEEVLHKLQLEKKVKIENNQFSTTKLSQGQRKRLALLTAYLEDSPIYLFDEWAADQDPHFKEIFYRQILPELKRKGKTVFVISHDDHYYDAADRLIKLDYGLIESETLKTISNETQKIGG